jgi:HSP20 family protein
MAIDRTRGGFGYLPLRDAIDRLFAESVITPSSFSGGFPPADLFVTENDIVLEMAVPGAKPDDINVSITGDAVTISGEVRHEHRTGQPQAQQGQGQGQAQQRGSQSFVEEIWRGRFQRSFTLPTEVDSNNTEASFDNGILTIRMPKSEAAKPRKIQVKPGQQTISGQTSQGQMQKETVPVQGSQSS